MNKKELFLKIIIILVVVTFFIYFTMQLFPIFKELLTSEGRENFKATIDSLGIKGVLLLIGLMCSQILLPILPGEPVEILGGMCFGPFKGLIIILLGIFISTLLIIFLIKVLGKRFIYLFVKKERIEKIENSKFFKNEKRIEIIIFLLYFIPGTPKDIITYIAVLLPINIYRFIAISTVARIPSVLSSTIAGSNLVSGNLLFSIVAYIVTFGVTAIFIYFINKKDKNLMKMVDEIK